MQAAIYWRYLITKQHLKEHYYERIQIKPSIGMDKVTPFKFESEIDDNINIIIRKIRNKTYKFTRYKQLLFTKGANKSPRVVCVPTLRDKLVTSIINELLFEVYNNVAKTPMPQIVIKDVEDNRRDYDCFIKLDIEKYYASINQSKLLQIIRRKIKKDEILHLIEQAIRTESIPYPVKEKIHKVERISGIPEGLPISNALANIYMSDIDKKYMSMPEIKYYRYVDDILILVNENKVSEIIELINRDIQNLGLKFNDKTSVGKIENGFEYLGYKIGKDIITVRNSSVLKLEQSIEDLFREIKGKNLKYIQWKINLKITGFILDDHKYGWLFFYSQINDEKLLFHLDYLVDKLAIRYKVREEIQLKRFVRCYFEIKYGLHTTHYIPNLDEITIDEKRELLSEIYSLNLTEKSDDKIELEFRKIMRREIRDIEKDVQNIS